MRLRGIVEEDELRQISENGKAVAITCGYYIVICDSIEALGMSAAARRYNAAFNKANPDLLGASIVFGANAASRLIIGLIVRGMYLLSIMQLRVLLVKDEEAALAVAQTERRRLQAEAALRRSTQSSVT